MFKLPAAGSPQRCALAVADACTSPDGSEVWSEVKDRGTALLKAGQPARAARLYEEAGRVAGSQLGRLQPFLNGLHTRSSGSPLHLLAGNQPLLEKVAGLAYPSDPLFAARRTGLFRPAAGGGAADSPAQEGGSAAAAGPQRVELVWSRLGRPPCLELPNTNVAVCAGNEAAAWLQAGDAEASLAAALRAVAAAPEYPKGYQRVMRALEAGVAVGGEGIKC
jgi:hypothetical protein